MEDDECSPECLLTSEPVKDAYSSDEEKDSCRKYSQKKFWVKDNIDASSIRIWEMVLYMHIQYRGEPGLKSYQEVESVEDFVANAFNFICPEGVPEFFKLYLANESDWSVVAKGVVKRFFEEERFKWMKDNFFVDYTCEEKKKMQQIRKQKKILRSLSHSSTGVAYPHLAEMHLIKRIDELFMNASKFDTVRCQKDRHHEATKGAFYEMLSYIDVPVVYNGEARVDFDYLGVHKREGKPAVHFSVKPDGILHHYAYESNLLLPYAAIKVYGPYDEKAVKTINDSPSKVKRKTDRKSEMFLNSTIMASLSLKDQDNIPSGNEKEDMTDVDASCTRTINQDVKEVGPELIQNSQAASQKFYAELCMEMFGILAHKNECKLGLSNDHYELLGQNVKLGCLGIFVMNQNVFLAKMTHPKSDLESKFSKVQDIKFVCAKDFWFNLRKPNDRFGLMIFLRSLLYLRVYQHKLLLQALSEDEDSFPSTIW